MSIPQIDFPPLDRTVPQIGLGCGRLVGRAGLRKSARIVETALELGIRYFDVAPSYGMGTAEEVLGEVVGNSPEVIVVTKVGIPRPSYSARRAWLRRWGKPWLDRSRAVKTLARRFYAPPAAPSPAQGPPPRRDFSEAALHASIEESLRRLQRDKADVLLAHEPVAGDLDEELAARFENLEKAGLINAFGAGVDVRTDRWSAFGSVWQSGWPEEAVRSYARDLTYVFHGVIRYAGKGPTGKTLVPASRLLREAVSALPTDVMLVSASTPSRLRDLLSEL